MKGLVGMSSLVLVLAMALSLPFTAHAEEKKGTYVAVKGGVFIPTNELDNKGFDKSLAAALTVGNYYTRNIALEASVGYYQSDASKQLEVGSEKDDLWVIPVTMTMKGVLPLGGLELNGGGGLGLYYANARAKGYGTEIGDYSHRDDAVAFGAHLVAGATLDLGSHLFIGAEGQYVFTTGAKLFSSTVNLDGIIATGVVGYRF